MDTDTHTGGHVTGTDADRIADRIRHRITTVPADTEMGRLATITAQLDEAQLADDTGRETARILAYIVDRYSTPTARGRGRS